MGPCVIKTFCIKKLLSSKEETPHRMGETYASYKSDRGLPRMYKVFQKSKSQDNKQPNKMGYGTEWRILKKEKKNV